MFDRILKEINICLDNNAILAALALTLTLPDAFGAIEYPKEGTRSRYIKWVDTFSSNIINQKATVALPKLDENSKCRQIKVSTDGELLFHIRNTLLHEATTKISSNKIINSITLVDDEKNQFDIYSHSFGSTMLDDDESTINIHYRLSIRALVDYLKIAAENYYDKNKDKLKEYEKDWTIKMPKN